MIRKTLLTTAYGLVLAALASMSAIAQNGMGGPQGSPRHDPKTELTVKGTVEEVQGVPERGWLAHRSARDAQDGQGQTGYPPRPDGLLEEAWIRARREGLDRGDRFEDQSR